MTGPETWRPRGQPGPVACSLCPCQQRAPQSDRPPRLWLCHSHSHSHSHRSQHIVHCTMCKSQVSNKQSNFVASATKLDYSFDNWHLVECKGAWGVIGLVGIVLLVVWLKRQYASNCARRPHKRGTQEAAPAPAPAPPMAMAMTMAPPRFTALEYTPQPLYQGTRAPGTRASQQWNTDPNIRSHQEAPQEVEGVENRELPLLQEMRRFS